MGEIEFIFQVSEYDSQALLPQVSRALQRRMELRNQQLHPGKANYAEMTEEERKKARIKSVIWGIVWVAVGLYLLISGLGKGEDGNKWLPIIGIVCIFVGSKRLLPQRKVPATDKFDSAAKEFLDEHKGVVEEKERQVCFSDEELVIVTGALEDLEQEAVDYDDVEFAMETEDIFLLVHSGHGILLQKKDITLGSVEEFRDYLAAHVKSFTPYKPEVEETAVQPENSVETEEVEVEVESEVIETEVEVESAEEGEETEESEE